MGSGQDLVTREEREKNSHLKKIVVDDIVDSLVHKLRLREIAEEHVNMCISAFGGEE